MTSLKAKITNGGPISNGVHQNGVNHESKSSTGSVSEGYSYEEVQKIADYVLSKTKYRPELAIICGSGLGGLADQLVKKDSLDYSSIPNFPVSTVPGHAGRLVFGLLGDVPVVCMQGRFHSYEGYPLWKCTLPVRVMKLMGIQRLILTNAAGGVNAEYKVGDVVMIKDHIYLQGAAGSSPLIGPNDERFGPRFLPLNNPYDKKLRNVAKQLVKGSPLEGALKEGVYCMFAGPTYETVAEIRMLQTIGADLVGMSTVPEVIVARHCGIEVFAFSLVTNECVSTYETSAMPNHKEVLAAADARKLDLQNFVKNLVKKFDEGKITNSS